MNFEIAGQVVSIEVPESYRAEQSAWESLIAGVTGGGCGHQEVEYECGGCCHLVKNVKAIIPIVCLGIVVLLPKPGEKLIVKTFDGCEWVEARKFSELFIGLDRICAVGMLRKVASNGPPVVMEEE